LYDQLRRVNAALPQVREWMDSLRAQHASASVPVARCGFPRLPQYFSRALLDDVRVVSVSKIPFPPLADYGLREVADIVRMGLAAITFDDTIYVHQSLKTESIHFHELVHAVQWRTLGVDRFLLTYGIGVLQHGYAHNPLEALAYDLQSQFDRSLPIPNLEANVEAHAREMYTEASTLFERHQLPMVTRP
jgi:hypothetical protein